MFSIYIYIYKSIFGWREREDIERVQMKYIRWCLGLERSTPGYIVLEETKRDKIRIKAGKRARKFEEGGLNAEGRKWVKECIKEKREGRVRTRSVSERIGYLKRNGYSQEGITQLEQEGREMHAILEERDREVQAQVQVNSIKESRYNKYYKSIRCISMPEYLSKRGEGNSQKLIARARCGNLDANNRYWMKEEERRCGLCERGPGTLKHLIEDCTETERLEYSIERVLEGTVNGSIVEWMREIERKFKRKER